MRATRKAFSGCSKKSDFFKKCVAEVSATSGAQAANRFAVAKNVLGAAAGNSLAEIVRSAQGEERGARRRWWARRLLLLLLAPHSRSARALCLQGGRSREGRLESSWASSSSSPVHITTARDDLRPSSTCCKYTRSAMTIPHLITPSSFPNLSIFFYIGVFNF